MCECHCLWSVKICFEEGGEDFYFKKIIYYHKNNLITKLYTKSVGLHNRLQLFLSIHLQKTVNIYTQL